MQNAECFSMCYPVLTFEQTCLNAILQTKLSLKLQLMRLNLARTQQVVESSVSLRQQLASFRIGRSKSHLQFSEILYRHVP